MDSYPRVISIYFGQGGYTVSLRIRMIIVGLVLAVLHPLTQAAPVDVDGDGRVGPQEVIDLSQHWKGLASPQPWQINGSSIFYNTGNVGIGTATPETKLHVKGTSWFQGDNTPLPFSAGKGIAIGFAGEQGYIFGFDYTNFLPKNLLLQNPGGNVGIGTLSPTSGRLHVEGGNSSAVFGNSTGGSGLVGQSSTNNGVYGYSGSGNGVFGFSSSGNGFYGYSGSGFGVEGLSNSHIGVYGHSSGPLSGGVLGIAPYIGVQGSATGSDVNRQAVRGDNGGSATGYAGLFNGNTWVVGTLTKNAGSFKIDHPLDPENKYLSHSFVESPDMMNIYNGNIVTDNKGYAEIVLPEWFEALNRDFRYQLTVLDDQDSADFVQAKVVRKVIANKFTIRTSRPGVEVSWQVTGIRQDAWANAHRIAVEEDKLEGEKGKYVNPGVFGQSREKGLPAIVSGTDKLQLTQEQEGR